MQEYTEQQLLELINDPDTDMFTQAEAMYALCARYGYTQNSLAKQVGVSQSCIGNKTRLLQFSAHERDLIREHGLTERHARALLRAKPPRREKLIATAGGMHLTVQQTEELIETHTFPESANEPAVQTLNADVFVQQTQAGAQRLCAAGYKTTYMIESGESWRRITITILE